MPLGFAPLGFYRPTGGGGGPVDTTVTVPSAASATLTAPDPTLTGIAILSVTTATATATAPDPSIVANVAVAATVASATATAPDPTVSVAFPTWSNGYSFSRQIGIRAAALNSAGSIPDFLLYLDISAGWLRRTTHGGEVTSATGDDIRFETTAAVKLPHQIISYSSTTTTGRLRARVRVGTLDNASQLILYCYTGNSAQITSEEEPAAALVDLVDSWSALTGDSEKPLGDDLTVTGSLAAGSTTLPGISALYPGGGLGRLASDTTAPADYAGRTEMTVQFWMQPDSTVINTDLGMFAVGPSDEDGEVNHLVSVRHSAGGAFGGGDNTFTCAITTNNGTARLESASNAHSTATRMVTFAWRAGELPAFYLNGVATVPTFVGTAAGSTGNSGAILPAGSLTTQPNASPTPRVHVGVSSRDTLASESFKGSLSMPTVYANRLTAQHVWAYWSNQGDPAGFYSIGGRDLITDTHRSVVAIPALVATNQGTSPDDIDLAALAYKPSGVTATLTNVETPTSGSVSIVGGKARYVVAQGFSGDASFFFTITDMNGKFSRGKCVVRVAAVTSPSNDYDFGSDYTDNYIPYFEVGKGSVTQSASDNNVTIRAGDSSGPSVRDTTQDVYLWCKNTASFTDYRVVVEIRQLDPGLSLDTAQPSGFIFWHMTGNGTAGHPANLGLWTADRTALGYNAHSTGYRATIDPRGSDIDNEGQVRVRAASANGGLGAHVISSDDYADDVPDAADQFQMTVNVWYRYTIEKVGTELTVKMLNLDTEVEVELEKTSTLADDYTSGIIGFGAMQGRAFEIRNNSINITSLATPSSPELPVPLRRIYVGSMTQLRAYFNGSLNISTRAICDPGTGAIGAIGVPRAGDEVNLCNGDYSGNVLAWAAPANIGTTETNRIVIKAANKLQARFVNITGQSLSVPAFKLSTIPYVVVWGIHFDGTTLEIDRCNHFRVIFNKFEKAPTHALRLQGPILEGGQIGHNDMTVAGFTENDYQAPQKPAGNRPVPFIIPYTNETRSRRAINVDGDDLAARQVQQIEIFRNYFHHLPPKGGPTYNSSSAGAFSAWEGGDSAGFVTSLRWHVHHNRIFRAWYWFDENGPGVAPAAEAYGPIKIKSADNVFAYNAYVEMFSGLDQRQGYGNCYYGEYFDGNGVTVSNFTVYAGHGTSSVYGDDNYPDRHYIVGCHMKRTSGLVFASGTAAPVTPPAQPLPGPQLASFGAYVIATQFDDCTVGAFGSAHPATNNHFYDCRYGDGDFDTGTKLVGGANNDAVAVQGRFVLTAKQTGTKVFPNVPANWSAGTRLADLGYTGIPGRNGVRGPRDLRTTAQGDLPAEVGPEAPWGLTD